MWNFIAKNKAAKQFLLFGFFVVLSSWIRWYATGTLKADDNYIYQDIWLYICLSLYFIGIVGLTIVYYKIVTRYSGYDLDLNSTRTLSYAGLILFTGMTVMLTSDIYVYLAEGNIALKGIYTYTDGSRLLQSQYIDYVSPWWKTCPNHYGPPLLFLFSWTSIFGDNILVSYFIFKLIIFCFAIFLPWVVGKIMKFNSDSRYNTYALIVLAPVLMIESVGQLHVEVIIALGVALFIYLQNKNLWVYASIPLGLVISCKIMYSIILLPFMVGVYYSKYKAGKSRLGHIFFQCLASLGIIISIIAITYSFVWEGWETIVHPYSYHSTKTPSRSFTEIIILVYKYLSEFIGGRSISELIALSGTKSFLSIEEVLRLKNLIAPYFSAFGLILAVWNLFPMIYSKSIESVSKIIAKLWIIVITVYSPIFNPWYFIPILVLLYSEDKKSWIYYAIFTMSSSISYQIGHTIPAGNYLGILATVNMFLMLGMFLYQFKNHFILEPLSQLKNKSTI